MTPPSTLPSPKLIQLGNALDDVIQQLASLFDLIPAATYVQQLAPGTAGIPQTVYASPDFERITGYPPDAWWQADFWATHVHPDDLAGALAIRQRLRHEDRIEHEYRFRHRDGHDIWIHDRLSVQRHETAARLIVGLWWDVSERRNAEQVLAAHRDLLLTLQRIAADPEAAMRAILDTARALPGIDCGGIYDVDHRNGHLTLAVHAGLSDEYVAATRAVPRDSCPGVIARAGQPRYSFRDLDLMDLSPAARQEGLRAVAILPILHDGQTVACLKLASHRADTIPDLSCRTLETLALQLGEVLLRIRGAVAAKIQRQNLLALFEALDDFVFVLDEAGDIVYQNPTVERRLGYGSVELQGRGLLAVHPPEQHAEVKRTLDKMPTSHREAHQAPLQTRSGETIPVETRILRGQWNDRPALISVSRDISELLASQRQVAEERILLRTLYETLPDLLWIKDPEGRFLFCNRAFTAYYGAPEAAIVGKSDYDFVDAETAAFYREKDRAALAAGESRTNEEWLVYPDGRRILVETTKTPVRGGDGQWLGVLGIAHDITARHEAQESVHRLYQAIEQIPVSIMLTDLEARIEYVNAYFTQATGYSREEALGQSPSLLKSGETPPGHYQQLWKTITDGGIWTGELHNRRKDGSLYWEHAIIGPVRDLGGRIAHFLAIKEDITARRQAEQRLRLAASVFKHAHEGIVVTDANGIIVEVNDAFSALTGYSREEALGQNPRFLQSGRHDPEFFATLWQALIDKGLWTGELWNRKKNGELYAENASISAVRDEAGRVTHYVNVFADITDLKDSQRRLENLAYHDPLTQLPNRALLADRLQLAIAQAERQGTLLAVCYLDLDGFKPVNDTLGHAVGDQLLIAVAGRLRACVRGGDTVARLGGDEFVVLFGGLSGVEECKGAVARLLRALSAPHVFGEHSFTVTASIGVALHSLDGGDADTLLRHADQAMYLAKQAGHNRYWLFDAGGSSSS
ncbi:MAG: PAS domain S-box protein [Candidatus Competibacter sp.]|nr:PAS domain S-box protein [Candidatus Competibacter sp.]MDG4584261.1 PAS domain S-box protein [Candidatus Competibacter sp.]